MLGFFVFSGLTFLMSIFLAVGYLPQCSYGEFFVAKRQFKNFAFWKTIIPSVSSVSLAAAAFFSHNILIAAAAYFASITLLSWITLLGVIYKNKLFLAFKQNKVDKDLNIFSFYTI